MEHATKPEDLLKLLNGKYASLKICFNDNANLYSSPEDWEEYEDLEGSEIYWPSEEERKIAIKDNSVWIIEWWPETSLGFGRVAASTFEKAARFALEELDKKDAA